jgi:hypothetical protein
MQKDQRSEVQINEDHRNTARIREAYIGAVEHRAQMQKLKIDAKTMQEHNAGEKRKQVGKMNSRRHIMNVWKGTIVAVN